MISVSKQVIQFNTAVFLIVFIMLVGCTESSDPNVLFEQGKYELAYERWKPMAETGDLSAQNYMGIHHYLGLGVSRDYKKAKQWFERAAVAGHADAQYNLGLIYENREYVEHDYVKAYNWFYEAQENGNANARKRLKGIRPVIGGYVDDNKY